jgi:tRNA threonylcarbamoyladenosine biosynthesis protein TsaE
MRELGAKLPLKPGDTVYLYGDLGAGKTTLVRGFVEAHGEEKIVRSPTFNLIQMFDTDPPVLHADLYRVQSYRGLGIEDYLETQVCFIEWPDRAEGLLGEGEAWIIKIDFSSDGRVVSVDRPHKNEGD